jgi:glycerophosphoryl diester phosphodiesterase
MEPLRRPPIGFGHRGARAHAPENTIESFQLALRLGATGLESDVWLTQDGVPVLDHDGVQRRRGKGRKHAIAKLTRDELDPTVPTLAELYEKCGTDYELSLDIKDNGAAAAVIEAARAAPGAEERLWLCHGDWERVATWRELSPSAHLVDSTRIRRIKEGPERRAANLAEAGIDAINLHASDWTGGLTTLFHRFERLAFGWDAQHERVLLALLAMGIDAVYSDHVDRMMQALEHAQR